MSEAIAQSIIGTMTYLAPVGSMTDEAACKVLQDTIANCISSNQIHLILDLEQVTILGSHALEIMLDSNTKLTQSGGALSFVNPSVLVKDILISTGLGDQTALNTTNFGDLHAIGEDFSSLPPMKLGEILLQMGVVTEKQVEEAWSQQSKSNKIGRAHV